MRFLVFLFLISFNVFAVDYKYDDAKRITEATYKDGTVVSYTYDQNGNLLSVTPNENSSGGGTGGGDTGGGGTGGGNTGGGGTPQPEIPEPVKQDSSGGTFGVFSLLLIAGLIVLRFPLKPRFKVNKGNRQFK